MKVAVTVICTLLTLALLFFLYVGIFPSGRAMWNNWWHDVEKADDNTDYANRKQVEDTCRAMMAQYNNDKLIYEQYKDSDNAEEVSWANNAKIRANSTASNYNNYMMKNSYIWKDNIPSDIKTLLPYLD